MPDDETVYSLTEKLIGRYKLHHSSSAFTVAVSGIDASGKGYTGKLLQQNLEDRGYHVANINIDPWQNPLPVRLQKENPAEGVYENIFRWKDFFEQLLLPLQKNKTLYLKTEGIHSHSDEYYPLVYDFKVIDIILVEGILLFKKKYLSFYDYKIWIDCSFETGLKRAIKRNVEQLEKEKLIEDYNTYYYPAQRLHFEKDNPRRAADIIFCNEETENLC